MSIELPPSARKVADAASGHGLTLDIIEYPDGTRTAADAAAAVGCEVDQIVKSMIFSALGNESGETSGELVLALTSGGNRVDGDALATLAAVARCGRADVDAVRATTGYAIGGVPPFGHQTSLRTWVDPRLLDFDVVWAAAGTPRHVFAVEPTRLVEITGAVVGDFTL